MKKILSYLFISTSVFTFAQSPNYSEDIAPILYNNCTECHNTGGIAPFSLMNYQEASSMAPQVVLSVISGSKMIEIVGINIPNPKISRNIPIKSKNVRMTSPFLCFLVIRKFIFLSVLNIYNLLSSQLDDCILSPRPSIRATFISSQTKLSGMVSLF